jgi:hypothetical protein
MRSAEQCLYVSFIITQTTHELRHNTPAGKLIRLLENMGIDHRHDPMDISGFRDEAVMLSTQGFSELIEKFWFFVGCR